LNSKTFTARILTVSDRGAAGLREDLSAPRLQSRLEELGYRVLGTEIVGDGRDSVALALRRLCDIGDAQLLLTTGGSGLSPRDLTPEATRAVGEREVPGLMELARRRCAEITPFAALGRGVAVTVASTLVLNLPGHPQAACQTLDAIADLLPHALEILARTPEDCDVTGRAQERGGKR